MGGNFLKEMVVVKYVGRKFYEEFLGRILGEEIFLGEILNFWREKFWEKFLEKKFLGESLREKILGEFATVNDYYRCL